YLYMSAVEWHPAIPTGGTLASHPTDDFNDYVYTPLKTCRVRFGDVITIRRAGSFQREQVPLHQVTLTVSDIDKVRPVGNMVSDLLEDRHVQKDWLVTVPLDRLEHAQREKDRFTMLLVVIALISMLVGGIGIVNILLANVTER